MILDILVTNIAFKLHRSKVGVIIIGQNRAIL